MEQNKQIETRTDNQLRKKLRYIAKHEGRSVNSEMTYLLRKYVEEFENVHGKIEFNK